MAHSASAPPSVSSRILGLAGIVGGAVLVAALLVEIGPALNQFRLLVFTAGAIAVAVAVHRRQAHTARTLALLAAIPVLIANGLYFAMVALAIARPDALGAEYALIWSFAGAALWLTDAWFGFVTLRLGVASRSGAFALAVGSLLAFLPLVSAVLTPAETPAIVAPLGLAGLALSGIAWIILGIDVGTRRRAASPPAKVDGTNGPELFASTAGTE